jgi:hypothetical protein
MVGGRSIDGGSDAFMPVSSVMYRTHNAGASKEQTASPVFPSRFRNAVGDDHKKTLSEER